MSKKVYLVLSLVLIMCGIAMAASKPLSDSQLATVTAGSGFGASGVVALPGSDVDVTTEAKITLSGSAMQDAKSLSIGNTVGGALAVGVNVWDGSTATDERTFTLPGFGVKQVNYLTNALPAASGAFVEDYFSKGSVFVKDPSLKISNTYLDVDLGFVNKSEFKVSNTYDQFLGLAAAGRLEVEPSRFDTEVEAAGAICVICNTFDRFKLSDKDFTAAWANLDYDKYSLEAKADVVKTRGPIFIDEAYAQYFVGEDASLDAKDITSLALSDSTLKGASAVYIVNSVNSLVGVGVNVASASSGLSKQVNIISNGSLLPVVGTN